jgi:hypothetical protein
MIEMNRTTNLLSQEREENLRWKEVIMKALKLKVDKLALKSVKEFYFKYLLDFEIYYCGSTSFSSIGNALAEQSSANISATSSDQNGGQHTAMNQNLVDNVPAPPRNKHKKIRVSFTVVFGVCILLFLTSRFYFLAPCLSSLNSQFKLG